MSLFWTQRLRNTPARLMAGVLAILALVAQVGSVAHLAVVQHVACAEHGEMIELSAHNEVHTSVAANSDRTIGSDGATSHGHDHCQIVAFRRERVRFDAPVDLLYPATPSATTQRAILRCAPTPTLAVVDFAPKTSPPV